MFSRITTVGVVLGMAAVSRDGPFKFLLTWMTNRRAVNEKNDGKCARDSKF